MAVLNITPDSFSDGGLHTNPIESGLRFLAEGADILDIGGESTRPGATPVSPAEEQRRILPVIATLARHGARISVDTRNASTMRAALEAGAHIVNDVSGLTYDPESLSLVAARQCPVILMHMRGTPQTMMSAATYTDVIGQVLEELGARIERALLGGIAGSRLIIDPGLGFAKDAAQSLALMQSIPRFAALGFPVLIGASRKGFIGALGGEPDPARRGPGSIAAALFAAQNGAAILRVHDVAETAQALKVWRALTEVQ